MSHIEIDIPRATRFQLEQKCCAVHISFDLGIDESRRLVKSLNDQIQMEERRQSPKRTNIPSGEDKIVVTKPMVAKFLKTMDDIGVSSRAKHILFSKKIFTVGQLAARREREFLGLRGFGNNCLVELVQKLLELDLLFDDAYAQKWLSEIDEKNPPWQDYAKQVWSSFC